MSNVYRAPDLDKSKPEPTRVELRPGDARVAPNATLELAAANTNVILGQDCHYVDRNGKKIPKYVIRNAERDTNKPVPEYFRQPFWFLYEQYESLVVYAEAPMVREWVKDERGKDRLRVSFEVDSTKDELRKLLINWYSAAQVGTPLAQFAANRGFRLKSARRD